LKNEKGKVIVSKEVFKGVKDDENDIEFIKKKQ